MTLNFIMEGICKEVKSLQDEVSDVGSSTAY